MAMTYLVSTFYIFLSHHATAWLLTTSNYYGWTAKGQEKKRTGKNRGRSETLPGLWIVLDFRTICMFGTLCYASSYMMCWVCLVRRGCHCRRTYTSGVSTVCFFVVRMYDTGRGDKKGCIYPARNLRLWSSLFLCDVKIIWDRSWKWTTCFLLERTARIGTVGHAMPSCHHAIYCESVSYTHLTLPTKA